MNIVFFGTPDIALPSLEKIMQSDHKLVGVVTAPDKERGRGRQVSYTPVKQFAVDNNIPCLQPDKLKDEKFISDLRSLNADVFVVLAFRILPREVYTIPPKGSFNLHGSLLPKYRGAAPIQWALINGDKETGVTTFCLQDKVDTGNIIMKKSLPIDAEDNFETLHDKMGLLGADVILETLNLIDAGEVKVSEQDDSLATPASKITKEMCRIDWNKKAADIHNLIRGLSPFPGPFFEHNNKRYKIYKTEVVENSALDAGEISTSNNEILIGCTDGALRILEIQPEGRKRINAEDFLRGYKF